MMVINYVKEQISLGQIEARKIHGKLNIADLHTKPLRCSAFATMAKRILGQPAQQEPPTTNAVPAEIVPQKGMDVTVTPTRGQKRNRSDTPKKIDDSGAKRRKAHVQKFITAPVLGSAT
jgi:hypothetical protein